MIEVRDLKKVYGDHTVLDGLNFSVEPGIITGFVGPNGAGKSTTMKIIAGFETPTSGSALVDSKPFAVAKSPTHELGTSLGAEFLPASMTGVQYLGYICTSAGIKGANIQELLEYVGLGDAGQRKISGYSMGMKQRIGIAAALLGDPANLMLDEPVNGLDVNGIMWLRGVLREQAQRGKTVFLSSHIMSELEQVIDRVIMIDKGHVVRDDTVQNLQQQSAASAAVLVRSFSQFAEIEQLFLAEGLTFEKTQGGLLVSGKPACEVGALVFGAGLSLDHLETVTSSLEDIYLQAKEQEESHE